MMEQIQSNPPAGAGGENKESQFPPKRELKKIRLNEAARKRRMRKIGWIGGAVVLAAILIGGGIWYSSVRSGNLPGEFIPDDGRQHVGPGYDHVYNSNPPTSGPHFGQVANWGAYKEELPDQVFIHNMEHGGVWISYRPGISEDIIQKLENFHEQYGRKIIVAPRSKNDADIALAAWNRLDKFSAGEFTEERVNSFIKAYRNKGPEFVP